MTNAYKQTNIYAHTAYYDVKEMYENISDYIKGVGQIAAYMHVCPDCCSN